MSEIEVNGKQEEEQNEKQTPPSMIERIIELLKNIVY